MPLSYDEAIAVLGNALVFGTNPSLQGIRAMVAALGDPASAFATIQVAGTNGKTSTSRMIAALIDAHGHRSGLYTSPELERYPERIEIAGAVVSDDDFAAAIAAAMQAAEEALRDGPEATEFELLTAAALWLFRERCVDFAVLEVGLGGRWDATSVTSPSVAVITGVGLDHTAILGTTREQIASEKAAIIKPACAPVLGPGTTGVEQAFLERAEAAATHARAVREVGAATPVDEALTVRYKLHNAPDRVGGVTVVDVAGVHGDYDAVAMRAPSYQAANIATAIASVEAALGKQLDPDDVRRAFGSLSIPGRFEMLSTDPIVVVDAAHNPQAALALSGAIDEVFGAEKPTVLLGVLADKDARGIVEALAPSARRVVVTQSDSPRALSAESLADVVRESTGREPDRYPTVAEALTALLHDVPEGLVISGSITTAGEARGIIRRR